MSPLVARRCETQVVSMAHTRKKMFYAPKAFNGYGPPEPPIPAAQDRPGRYPCPCCGQITLPVPPEEAVAYICPVCWWENDVFISSDNEPSDENHGLTLSQGRENVRRLGIGGNFFFRDAFGTSEQESPNPCAVRRLLVPFVVVGLTYTGRVGLFPDPSGTGWNSKKGRRIPPAPFL